MKATAACWDDTRRVGVTSVAFIDPDTSMTRTTVACSLGTRASARAWPGQQGGQGEQVERRGDVPAPARFGADDVGQQVEVGEADGVAGATALAEQVGGERDRDEQERQEGPGHSALTVRRPVSPGGLPGPGGLPAGETSGRVAGRRWGRGTGVGGRRWSRALPRPGWGGADVSGGRRNVPPPVPTGPGPGRGRRPGQ